MDTEPIAWPDDAPDLLSVMREVIIGRAPRTPIGRALTQWLTEKPVAYSEKFLDLEAKYWASKSGGSAQGKWDGFGRCPVCGVAHDRDDGAEAQVGVLQKWLDENKQ